MQCLQQTTAGYISSRGSISVNHLLELSHVLERGKVAPAASIRYRGYILGCLNACFCKFAAPLQHYRRDIPSKLVGTVYQTIDKQPSWLSLAPKNTPTLG